MGQRWGPAGLEGLALLTIAWGSADTLGCNPDSAPDPGLVDPWGLAGVGMGCQDLGIDPRGVATTCDQCEGTDAVQVEVQMHTGVVAVHLQCTCWA